MIKFLLSGLLGERRWTQADLARKTGIRPTTICDMYNDLAKRINLEHLDLICDALDCEPTDLLTRRATGPKAQPMEDRSTGKDLKKGLLCELEGLTDQEAMFVVNLIALLRGNRISQEARTAQAPASVQQPAAVGEADFAKSMKAISRSLINAKQAG